MPFPRSYERGPIEARKTLGFGLSIRPFRVPMNAAPLKLSEVPTSSKRGIRFPRSYERGPIEANVSGTVSDIGGGFPRSYERGPIEAT